MRKYQYYKVTLVFSMLLEIFKRIPDHRRKQAQQFDVPHLLLFTVLAIVSGAHSYRMIHGFIKAHFHIVQKRFHLTWKRAPAYSTIRYIIHTLDDKELECAFREHAGILSKAVKKPHVSLDGKVVRGSFDHFQDQKALQVFSALLSQKELILAHEMIDTKTSEIPMAQKLFNSLGLKNALYTLDALHCQKKR